MHRGYYRFGVFHTPCELQLFGKDKTQTDEAAHTILKTAKRLEKQYSFFDPDSYLNRMINRRSSGVVELDAESAAILAKVRELSEKVNHRFDITLGTVKGCFDLPTLDQIKQCREAKRVYCGPERWRISKKCLYVESPHTLFDLGGVIKEYAVDEAAKILKRHKVTAGMINFGGDLYAHGTHPDGRPFEVGIKDPNEPSHHIATVSLQDAALTTSAHYERSREVEGERISHIMTDGECRSDLLSATVVASSALWCGIATTAMMVDGTIIPAEGEWLRVSQATGIETSDGLLAKID